MEPMSGGGVLTVLGWIVFLVIAFIVVSYAWHTYKMRTDSYYRYKALERLQDAEGEKLQAKMRGLASTSENAEIRELAEKLVGKDRR